MKEQNMSVQREWVARSDKYARQYLAVMRRFEPELLSWLGDAESDAEISELSEDSGRQEVAAYEELATDLRVRLAEENDPNVLADLGVLIDRCGQKINLLQAEGEHLLPYVHLPQTIFLGLRSLLDERNEPQRRTAALLRLRRYAGSESDEKPILERHRARLRSRLQDRRLLAPPRQALERDLKSSLTIAEGIGELFESCEVAGFEKDLGRLRDQLSDHDAFCREHLLPIARQDFRLPLELYQARLGWHGVDISVDELASRAKVEFQKTQREMRDLARSLTSAKLPLFSEYRPIVRELMTRRIPAGKLLTHYEKRLRKLWELLERYDVLSLPEAPVRLVAATWAESAVYPHLHMRLPRYLSGRCEPVEVVLPCEAPRPSGRVAYGIDVDAVSWSAMAHEAAHAVQASVIQQSGLSLVRVLRDDVVLSRETVRAEIERYTTLWSGHAPSYLYGYLREIERRTGSRRRFSCARVP
jgi:hypothetical protein